MKKTAQAAAQDFGEVMVHALDPVAWARDRIGFTCDPWQAKFLRSTSDRLLLNNSRQSGKSTVTAILAVHTAVFDPGSLTLLFSPTQRQSAELYAKVADVFRRMPNAPAMTSDNLTSCTLANGSRIKSLPGDARASRGFSAPALVLVDEAAYVEDDLINAIRPMMAVGRGRLVMMSTPAGRRGAFYHAWTKSAETWERTQVPASECRRIDPAFLETERATVGPDQFAAEYECAFIDAGGQLFATHDIHRAIIARSALTLPLANAVAPRAVPGVIAEPDPAVYAELPGDMDSYVVGLDLGQAPRFHRRMRRRTACRV